MGGNISLGLGLYDMVYKHANVVDLGGSSHSQSNLKSSTCKLNITRWKSSSRDFWWFLFHGKIPLNAEVINVWCFDSFG